MLKTESPWILSLQRDRKTSIVSADDQTDIVVIGGGVSGMMIAYFLIQNTNNRIVVLEKDKLSYGASGHNAGQAVAAFEVPYDELVRRYGREITDATYAAVNSAFDTLHEICEYSGVEILDTEALASFLDIKSAKERLDTPGSTTMYIPPNTRVNNAVTLEEFDKKIWSSQYAAAVGYRAGIVNCPVLLENLAKRFLEEHGDRFKIYEHSKADEIIPIEDGVDVRCNGYTIQGKSVVICTNGYPAPPIIADSTDHYVRPVAGYTIGRLGRSADACVRSYIPADSNDPYYYITRRPVKNRSLTCIGGLDTRINNWQEIEQWTEEDNRKCSTIETFFLQELTGFSGPRNYQWKGLMGYTDSNVRIAGRDPFTSSVYYSIGCNGIGILPAITSAEIISNQISGVEAQTTFFDPLIQRSEVTGNPAAVHLLSPPSRE